MSLENKCILCGGAMTDDGHCLLCGANKDLTAQATFKAKNEILVNAIKKVLKEGLNKTTKECLKLAIESSDN